MPVSPLAIVQARIRSTRLEGKMLLDLGGKPLVRWATDAAIEAFGRENVVAAIPASAENDELAGVLAEVCEVFRWKGQEANVLSRVLACALTYRWRPETVIARITPDDPFKVPVLMRRVVDGERLPVEQSCEAWTLQELIDADRAMSATAEKREHLTKFRKYPPPPAPPAAHPWSVDTLEDLQAARRSLHGHQEGVFCTLCGA